MAQKNTRATESQKQWQKPAVHELGNLRDFVRTGTALGKSSTHTDGGSMPGHEAMDS
jgi:hypothetical protein